MRLFWLEGVLGAPDFLTGPALPASLPAFEGRLALDFNPIGSTNPAQTTQVLFNGLFVTRVPEPGLVSLLGLAAVALCVVRGRRRRALPAAL